MRIWVILLVFLWPVPQAMAAPAIEIPSKAELAQLFGFSKADWIGHIAVSVGSLGARARQTPDGPVLELPTESGSQLTISLHYLTSDKRPDFIELIVGYRPRQIAGVSDAALQDAARSVEEWLAPEFRAIGSVHDIIDGKGVFFIVRPRLPEDS